MTLMFLAQIHTNRILLSKLDLNLVSILYSGLQSNQGYSHHPNQRYKIPFHIDSYFHHSIHHLLQSRGCNRQPGRNLRTLLYHSIQSDSLLTTNHEVIPASPQIPAQSTTASPPPHRTVYHCITTTLTCTVYYCS